VTTPAYVGLGANLGDPLEQLRAALTALGTADGVELDACSSVYRTAPIGGPADQPAYVNAVARLAVDLGPHELLRLLLEVERGQGRVRTVRFGPRTCDLDVLLFGDAVIADADLQVPHPRLAERRFVLEPLVELAPGLRLPDGREASALLAAVQDQAVERVDGIRLP
jgi:2-amino-4-hydroxy-6-hydroxymethyldihydropteridine diphosphokinase